MKADSQLNAGHVTLHAQVLSHPHLSDCLPAPLPTHLPRLTQTAGSEHLLVPGLAAAIGVPCHHGQPLQRKGTIAEGKERCPIDPPRSARLRESARMTLIRRRRCNRSSKRMTDVRWEMQAPRGSIDYTGDTANHPSPSARQGLTESEPTLTDVGVAFRNVLGIEFFAASTRGRARPRRDAASKEFL